MKRVWLKSWKSMAKVRRIKHEVVRDCGSYELRYPDGRPSKYFYFENIPARRLRPDVVVAERVAKIFAGAHMLNSQ